MEKGYVNMEDVNQLRNQQEYNKMLGETLGQINAFTPRSGYSLSMLHLQRFIQGYSDFKTADGISDLVAQKGDREGSLINSITGSFKKWSGYGCGD